MVSRMAQLVIAPVIALLLSDASGSAYSAANPFFKWQITSSSVCFPGWEFPGNGCPGRALGRRRAKQPCSGDVLAGQHFCPTSRTDTMAERGVRAALDKHLDLV